MTDRKQYVALVHDYEDRGDHIVEQTRVIELHPELTMFDLIKRVPIIGDERVEIKQVERCCPRPKAQMVTKDQLPQVVFHVHYFRKADRTIKFNRICFTAREAASHVNGIVGLKNFVVVDQRHVLLTVSHM